MNVGNDRSQAVCALSPELLEVENQSHLHAGHAGSPNSESHFRVTLKVEALNALSRVERYRKVHAILQAELDGSVHALSLNFVTD